jgi:hypothetical protein
MKINIFAGVICHCAGFLDKTLPQWFLTFFSRDPSYGFGDPILNFNYMY